MQTTQVTKKYEKDGKSAERSRPAIKWESLQDAFSYIPPTDKADVNYNAVGTTFQLTETDKKAGLSQQDKLLKALNDENERQAGILAYQEARFELVGEDTVIESHTRRIMADAAKLGKTITEDRAREIAKLIVASF